MPIRLLLAVTLALSLLAVPTGATEQPEDVPGPIDVIDLSGPIDGFAVDFVRSAIERAGESGAQAVILQIDSPGAVTERLDELIALVSSPPLPVVAWVGDAPATAYGGALILVEAAAMAFAAPGAEVGFAEPAVLGSPALVPDQLLALADRSQAVEGPIEGIIEGTHAALGPLIVALDGREARFDGGTVTLRTAEEVRAEDGSLRSQVVPEVRFREPGVFARTMRLALRPEAAFFFLVAGLAFVAFEFYAIGPGVAAATASLPLLLAGYGLVVLPPSWGLVVVLVAMWLLTADFQRGGFGLLSYLATALLFVGGLFITDTRPQLPPSWWGVALTTLGVALFYMFAMTTVARSRFTTPTIGREHLVGEPGTALDDASAGALTVEVDGARWRAVTHRESTIGRGDAVEVKGVRGVYLEVDVPG